MFMKLNGKVIIQRDIAIPATLTIVEAIKSKVFSPETSSDIVMMIKRDEYVFDCNISAGIVLEGISHTKSIADIISDFRSVFIDISEEEIKKDIQECIQNFVEKELIILDA